MTYISYTPHRLFLRAAATMAMTPSTTRQLHNGENDLKQSLLLSYRQTLSLSNYGLCTQDAGQELIRVDRAAGGIVVKAINQLQNKSSRDYYQQSAQLSLGDMNLSAITLNREYGKLEFPYKPMLRLALPIFDENMQRFGFIIATNTQILFNSLSELVQTPHSLILTDNEGYFLYIQINVLTYCTFESLGYHLSN